MNISFTEIPGQSPLYLDYLYNFKKVAKYYVKDFRNEGIYEPISGMYSPSILLTGSRSPKPSKTST